MHCGHASNEPDDQGGRQYETLGDPTLADAILDRVMHNAYRIGLTGESLRKRQAEALTA